MLVGWLDYHRETLAMKCEGLSAEQLARAAVPPSWLSLAGLLRHMAEIERTYFRRTFAGEDVPAIAFEEDPFREDPEADYSSVARRATRSPTGARRSVVRARSSTAHESLTDEGNSGLPMRFWLVKTLNEYARHNGHADLLRERIDGTTGE